MHIPVELAVCYLCSLVDGIVANCSASTSLHRPVPAPELTDGTVSSELYWFLIVEIIFINVRVPVFIGTLWRNIFGACRCQWVLA